MARKRTGAVTESLDQLFHLEERFLGKPVGNRIRMLTILKREPRRSLEEVALLIGVPAPTIKRWWRIYRGEGIDALIHPKQRTHPAEDQVFVELKKKLANTELRSLDEVRGWLDGLGESQGASRPEASDSLARRVRRRGGALQGAEQGEPKIGEELLRFLTSLPLELDTVAWIRQFSTELRVLLGDVDRISISVNIAINLLDPESFASKLHIFKGPDYKDELVKSTPSQPKETDADRLQRFLRDARTTVDMEQYHPPTGFIYHHGKAYIGRIILWRKRDAPPISEQTLRLMNDLHNFFLFLLIDVTSRSHVAQPAAVFFLKALSEFINAFALTSPEQRILMYLLLGYSYKEIARLISLSENTVRYHIKSIYAKAGVHGQAELFAKYFTVRGDSE
jgi:DNA-binding CsgD family transcriptional regulator